MNLQTRFVKTKHASEIDKVTKQYSQKTDEFLDDFPFVNLEKI